MTIKNCDSDTLHHDSLRPTRRHTLAASLAAATALSFPGLARAGARTKPAGPPSPLDRPVGLELYSLRALMRKDVRGTLAKVRKMGFATVEVSGFQGLSPDAFAAELKRAGLSSPSIIGGYERLGNDLAGSIADARAVGATTIICPWLPHEKVFTRTDCLKAIDHLNRAGAALRQEGMRLAYHIHGFEFAPSEEKGGGTLMDTLLRETSAETLDIELDVFWVTRGGGDPVDLLEKHGSRMKLMHLKDIAKGTFICAPNGAAPDETSVPLGDGMVDFPRVLTAAMKAGVEHYFIEDEHPNAEQQVRKSLAYLRGLKLS